MPSSEVRYLAQLQFILSEPVGRLLEQMPSLVRRLSTTTATEVETSAERVRGAIRWSETFSYRAATGIPHIFVTAPSHRAYNTAENQVLAFALFAIAEFGKRTGWHKGTMEGPAALVRTRVAEATRWLQARQLIDLPRHQPTPVTISRVRTGRGRLRYQAAVDVVELYQRYIARLDRSAIREAVENDALIASRDSVLLELHCAFDAIRALRQHGWQASTTGLLKPPLIFRANRGDATLQMTYQSAPTGLTAGSLYREAQRAHHFTSKGGLIPDLVIEVEKDGSSRWLMIEVKGGIKRSVADSARAAALDLLAYRRAFAPALDLQDEPYGLGYAWGEDLKPVVNSEVTFCTPDTLTESLAALLA
ncbi:hypothetical protein [Mycolicibacterium holsaticum]|uniref:hypothetical protein n=1 Tax=Mycolicibacterium holsaticum TaxID=152142 RepID=UPI001C7DE86D|nr:hypothetical protein [Mycolicibacterium holsaticum]QZA13629.1 hypothetical protein K3U96_05605 [Mycolicibacterium holsaticum DSM 44478 = JCM 12374]UNC08908.1 hypothetical protein H5U41_21230 [Mycolicibacterium holsaticum DSM 44478 = JCM 12374]